MSLNLSEDQNSLIRAKEAIDLERENLRTDARTLANLRSEHARLKDDFRSLFTSNERIKSDYCSLQTDYKVSQWSLTKPIFRRSLQLQLELQFHLGTIHK